MILDNQVVLVTGGTGSMGQRFVQRALSGEQGDPRRVIVFSRDEAKQDQMRRSHPGAEYILGDIRSYDDVHAAMRNVDIVVNAAALKQVPSCEYFPEQAILTNCVGAQNVVKAAHAWQPHIVVSISTDKACKPTTAMGMSKALQERIMIAANLKQEATRFVGVRYGNVLVSRGSVIPLFKEQIATGGPVTVTVPGMTRFLLTIDQAVDTTFAALKGAHAGEIYVPRAPSATIMNIALAMMDDRAIPIKITGIRPGEKMHEIMVSEEESLHVAQRGAHWAILPMLPELDTGTARCGGFEYSSAQNVLGLNQTYDLLKEHKLI